jgi:ligand-binding sensor domain-containing protein/two-component sensor histidine kinase
MRGLFVKTKINGFFAFWRAACLSLLFTAFVADAERLPVKIYTSADGLGSSATFNLVRDSRGFIWICSRDGLVRFDGYRFITYRIGDDDADPAVFNLLPTRSGVYWVDLNRGTDYRFIPKSDDILLEQIQRSPAKNDARIPLLAAPLPADAPLPDFEDRAGNLWTANEKGILLLREIDGRMTSELIELNLPGNPNKSLTRIVFKNSEQNDFGFWIGTPWGLVRRQPDGKTIHYAINPQNNSDAVFAYAEDKEQRVWIARSEGLVVLKTDTFRELTDLSDLTSRRAVLKQGIFDAEGQAQLPEQAGEASVFSFADILRRDSENSSKPDYLKPEIYSIICASDGRLWMTSNHGLIVFDGKRFHQYTSRQGLASNTIASVVEDDEGHIWLTTYGGLHRINPKGLTTLDRTDGLENERVHSIYEDRSGELVVVSGNFNISRLQPDGTFKMVRPGLPAGSVWMWSSNAALLDSRGDWWVNTQNAVYRYAGVSRIEDLDNKPPTAVYNEAVGLLSGNNVRVFEDSKGDVWFSSWVTSKRLGLTCWRRETGELEQFTKADGLPESFVAVAFAEDAAGNLWLGYTDGGITRFRDGRFAILNEPNAPKGGITNIFRDKRGRMWIASNREGLIRVDAAESEHPVFKRYTIADGLTSNNARCVTEDLYGNIYVGTVRGVNRLSPETGHIKYYGTSDGLASDFINTAYRDRHGMIWFGTFNGLSKLVPEPDTAPAPPPPVLISGLRIAGEDYSVSPLGQREVYVPQQSADRNNLQIEFLSIATGSTVSTRYQYKLEGVDADWSEPSAERSVTFANLLPGAYRFLVRAVNTDNAASAPALVSFTILRPVWQRWWFLLLAVFAVSFLIYAVYRYRIAQIIKLERVRTRIATDLHDDIGSSLSKIAILSEVVRQRNGSNGNRKDERNEPLEIIASTSREMVDSMSDIVWAINPERDHLSDLIQRMRHFAEELLDTQNIGYQFVVPENLKNIALGADQRREIYLIFKECINNLAKHSGASVAEIAVRLENENLIIEVKDNGRGFDVAEKSGGSQNSFGGNGLINMQKRARKCGGDFRIDSAIGKGTSIALEIPVGKNYFSV